MICRGLPWMIDLRSHYAEDSRQSFSVVVRQCAGHFCADAAFTDPCTEVGRTAATPFGLADCHTSDRHRPTCSFGKSAKQSAFAFSTIQQFRAAAHSCCPAGETCSHYSTVFGP